MCVRRLVRVSTLSNKEASALIEKQRRGRTRASPVEISWLSLLSVGRGYVLLTPSLTRVSSRKFLMYMRCSEGGTTEGGLVEGTVEGGRPKL